MRSSLGFWTLRDIMGVELYQKCIREFIKRWEGKHPTPWDFFFTCNNVSGEDYSWFFQPWFNQYGYPDLSIPSATYDNNKIEITIENSGGMPFPSKLIISYSDGSEEERILDGKQWSSGKQYFSSISTSKKPVKVQLDTSGYPDCNEGNNLFVF
jgi:aminopeptidase N